MDPSALPSPVGAVIRRLDLVAHPEGGWYRETHRSEVVLARAALPAGYPGDRCAVTAILYLLPAGARSARHRVRGEEIWLHHAGDDLLLTCEPGRGKASPRSHRLGAGADALPQAVVPSGWWQAAEALPGPHGYALVGCVVAPGFDFEDFEVDGGAGGRETAQPRRPRS